MAINWDNIEIICSDGNIINIDPSDRMIIFSGEPGPQGPAGPGGKWGEITGTLSDQTDLQDALDAKADIIISSASGAIASFPDGLPAPVTALNVAIEPVQDLHGQSNPYPAGGGANLVVDTARTGSANDCNSSFSNGVMTITGLASGNGGRNQLRTSYFHLDAGTYYFRLFNASGTPTADAFVQNGSSSVTSSQGQFTLAESSDEINIGFNVLSGNNYNYSVKPSISANDVASWSPYSNICPITGWSNAVVTRIQNLFDVNTPIEYGQYDNGVWTTSRTRITTDYIPISANVEYKMSIDPDNSEDLAFINYNYFDKNKTWLGNRITNGDGSFNGQKTHTFTISNTSAVYIRLVIRAYSNTDKIIDSQTLANADLTFLKTADIATLTIDLDGTRYGGYVDVLTGTMTVDRATVTYTGAQSESWSFYAYGHNNANRMAITIPGAITGGNNPIMGNYFRNYEKMGIEYATPWEGNTNTNAALLLYVPDTFTDAASWKTYLASNNLQILYYLNSPVTVQLTANQMQTLLGQNNIWANCGDTSVEYRADTKLFIEGQIAEANTKTRQMMTTVTTEMKAPKNLTSGDLVIVNDDLYKATANIASGATLTVGTNVTKITLAEYIQSLL